jgi:exodeoxyribonuclease V alpha subunit
MPEKMRVISEESKEESEVVCVFPITLYHAEDGIAKHIKRLLVGKIPWRTIEIKKAIPWVEKKIGLALSESQNLAVEKPLNQKS